jgi:diguanylate cyclase (GGDEF)-like protein
MDIDLFKQVNDTRGHWVGSKLLVELGRLLHMNLRRSDYAFRYGGDEFVVVLPDTPPEGATVAAERIRNEIEKYSFIIDGQKLKVTMSIGIAAYPDHAESSSDIIKLADAAMYEGKAKSRNIVIMAS